MVTLSKNLSDNVPHRRRNKMNITAEINNIGVNRLRKVALNMAKKKFGHAMLKMVAILSIQYIVISFLNL